MQWIEKCLNSCSDKNVIVVDNASTDKTVSFIRENFPNAKLLEQIENLGFGAANNIGISYALKEKCDYVFLLNQDAYLKKGVIENLIEVSSNNSDYGILSPIHLNGLGDKLDINFSNYLIENKELVHDGLQKSFARTIYEIPFVNAAAWLLPRRTLETIGGFDPIFYHYAEDDNYCQRVFYHNLKIGIVPESYILHDRGDRKKTNKISVSEKLILRERFLKYKWANINVKLGDEINKAKRALLKLIGKSLLRLKFENIIYYRKEIELIESIKKEILESRKINKQKGSHYLQR